MGTRSSKSSIQYTIDGQILPLNELFRGKPFFRKYMRSDCTENLIYRILYNKGDHPNVVDVYRITDDYVDMELLQEMPDTANLKNVIEVMEDVKRYLQRMNITYIDWKYENIGIGEDGDFKLFDFNGSGIFNSYDEWIFEAPPFLVMRNSPKGLTPIEIDNWAFEHFNYSFVVKEDEEDL